MIDMIMLVKQIVGQSSFFRILYTVVASGLV